MPFVWAIGMDELILVSDNGRILGQSTSRPLKKTKTTNRCFGATQEKEEGSLIEMSVRLESKDGD